MTAVPEEEAARAFIRGIPAADAPASEWDAWRRTRPVTELAKALRGAGTCPHCGRAVDQPTTFRAGEEWIEMHGWAQLYLVSTEGRAYSMRSGRIISQRYVSRGQRRPKQMQWRLYRNARDKKGTQVACAPALLNSFGYPVGAGRTVLFLNGDDQDLRLENMRPVSVMHRSGG